MFINNDKRFEILQAATNASDDLILIYSNLL